MPKSAFIILKSPQELDPTHGIKRLADSRDASAILLEDGVYQALVSGASKKLSESVHEVLVSREDLEARGFTAQELKIGKVVEYADVIDCIMERTDRTVTL
jgi:sulfur relay protein TusB/DsrH